ncbi:hypothetical protein HOLleu_31145 [Holothuria leucospilota]|uniref:Uncharacterized protein n=1 Tax=Holothuria leucospilota TaxID=206669 RepID=A0A9Q1BLR8_HOLLE|nr:hypothetical protein HOLleu_31145 [Holothuria leucospilota]
MMRSMFLVALLLASSYSHHGNAEEHDHDHDDAVEASLTGASLTVTFHASHEGHTDWKYIFSNSGVNPCDEITVNVVGYIGSTSYQEANTLIEIPDLDGDC